MKENEGVTKKRIFISFDYERDRDYRYLLKALSENPRSDIAFDDCTPEEIQSLIKLEISILTSQHAEI